MSHPAVIKASALIHAGDIAAAEAALTELVDTEGDHALVVVLDDLPPKDLLAIIREYDSSKPSVVNLLVTPKQFADAVIMERMYAERNHDRLRSMINSVIFRDDVDNYFRHARSRLEHRLRELVRWHVVRYSGKDAAAEEFLHEWHRLGDFLERNGGLEEALRHSYADFDTEPLREREVESMTAILKNVREYLAERSHE